jgi:Ca-activated chloride channel family protein
MDLSQSMDTKDFPAPDGTKIARIDAVRKVVSRFRQANAPATVSA